MLGERFGAEPAKGDAALAEMASKVMRRWQGGGWLEAYGGRLQQCNGVGLAFERYQGLACASVGVQK